MFGYRPFQGKTLYELADAHINSAIDFSNLPVSVPSWTKEMILKCTNKNPAKRYNSMLELRAELIEYLDVDDEVLVPGEV